MELHAATQELRRREAEIAAREETGGLVTRIIDALREATTETVQRQLTTIEPLLQRIYSRIDPHPALREVSLRSWFHQRRGHLTLRLQDLVAAVRTESPSTVLSSSQMNALAVATFLAFNVGIPTVPTRTAVLDDPLQSLDDVNLLGLIDLLRRVKDQRQVIVSTHDARFAKLLARKLRPIAGDERTVVVEIGAWSREGPAVTQYDVEQDRLPLRIPA